VSFPRRLVPVKTKASVRTIPLPRVVLEALSAQLARGDAPYGEAGLLFPPVTRQLISEIWRASAKRADLPDSMTYHSVCTDTPAEG
jgi:integrase